MAEKQVSIAIHSRFFKVFFYKHKELIESFIEVKFTNLEVGFRNLLVFYSSYAYYLSDEQELKKQILDSKLNFKNNQDYNLLFKKIKLKGVESLSFDELVKFYDEFFAILQGQLQLFESCCHTIAPSDIMPSVTDVPSDHEKNVVYATYDIFYECLFQIHSTINEKLVNFKITGFLDMTKVIMSYYYGYSYYMGKSMRKEVESDLKALFKTYNNKTFMSMYFKLIHEKITPTELTQLQLSRDEIFEKVNDIFEKINAELPKKNLMPRKTEKITVDMTLI